MSRFFEFARSQIFGGDEYNSPNLVSPYWRNIPSKTLLFTKVYPKASVTRRAMLTASLPINLEIAIVFIGVVLSHASRYLPGNRFLDATSRGRRTPGLDGIHWGAALIAGVCPLSGVFQATHVKPEKRPGLENDAIKTVSGAALVAPALFIWKCCNLQEWLDKLGRYGPRTLSCRFVQCGANLNRR
jgi:hypothetical protein